MKAKLIFWHILQQNPVSHPLQLTRTTRAVLEFLSNLRGSPGEKKRKKKKKNPIYYTVSRPTPLRGRGLPL
eukprot:COSAG06_NODE_32529_length_504_cov_1.232099_1_plen_70_part_10